MEETRIPKIIKSIDRTMDKPIATFLEWSFGTRTIFRKLRFSIKNKRPYNKYALGVEWLLNNGVGIKGKPNRILRHFTITLKLYNKIAWMELSWLGYTKDTPRLQMNDDN